jgi:hypothetical protein
MLMLDAPLVVRLTNTNNSRLLLVVTDFVKHTLQIYVIKNGHLPTTFDLSFSDVESMFFIKRKDNKVLV